MRIIADFHVHSKYSRATSKDMTTPHLAKWADKKGINIIASGDFQHPGYLGELKNKLKEAEPGLYRSKDGKTDARIILSTEISNIYKHDGKVRKIHTLVLMPTLKDALKFSKVLSEKGNTSSDGRPIFGFSARDLLKIAFDVTADAMVIPAHVWTPWFSIFGSKSGYNSIEECYGEDSKYIKAIETGLSSDPSANWRVSALDNITLISNSDAHSPRKIGREANVFDCNMTYYDIKKAIETKDKKKFLYTIEFFPEEGKYHYDGHRLCGVSYHPRESLAKNNRCPVCFKPLTLGVLHRVEELADRPWDFVPDSAIPQRHVIQLEEIISDARDTAPSSKKVQAEYEMILARGGTEFGILLDKSGDELKQICDPRIAEAVMRVRNEEVNVIPGYDGEFGKIFIYRDSEKSANRTKNMQMEMFDK
ncbi:MAG: endonuclease Q family protein [Spirochaetia bacterium]|nr:endonuclease Q family protein [Spirochaetia bacterium]